ncbi:hypothetical protein D2V17_14785 [Aurantiacibacter xanthus]|uniref:Uncharacterized protein n=1 Tax=Aurantiacibacter xanthus TaxID=1784712 RepID=A0A3A1P2K2_9SPHN|nr:hypothetical protein [Aurantiacibacter xanthus]RIV82580.1 hypothetical protein D2V17_14785 [Aurantiacibacter xanthus]
MKTPRFESLAMLCLAVSMVPSASAMAQEEVASPQVAGADLSGIWMPIGSAVDRPGGVTYTGADDVPSSEGPPFGVRPDLKGKYLESYNQRIARNAELGIEFKTSCKILGMPTIMIGPYAVEILQTANQINWAQEFLRETRRIYLDGRDHPDPDEVPATFEGYSTGHWEGAVLVVETSNIRGETTLGEYGHAEDALGHSEQLAFTERMFINAEGLLQVDGVARDPAALVRPWEWALTFRRAPAGTEFMEYVCEDNNTDTVDPETGAEVTTIPERRLPGILEN